MEELENEINTLENRVFRLECEKLEWRRFRDAVGDVVTMKTLFGNVSESKFKQLSEKLESIKYL